MYILVFKTNLSNQRKIKQVSNLLNLHPHIFKWNVDRHDVDKVLRVVSNKVKAPEVEKLLVGAGYYCEELQ